MAIVTKRDVVIWRKHFSGFYVRNLGSNLFAFGTIAMLNLVTPVALIKAQRDFIFHEEGWPTFFLFFPCVLLLVGLLQYRVQRHLAGAMSRMDRGDTLPLGMLEKARKRLLNRPLIIAFINLIAYLSVPALVVASLFFSGIFRRGSVSFSTSGPF